MESKILTKEGKLKKEFQPAIYLDSTVVIDYWIVENLDMPEDGEDIINFEEWAQEQIKSGNNHKVDLELEKRDEPYRFLLRELFKRDEKLFKIIQIRDKILYEDTKFVPVVSSLALNELMKWNAEVLFKEFAAEAVGTKTIQRIGNKQIGNYLKKIMEMRKEEINKQKNGESVSIWRHEGLKWLMNDLWLNRSFVHAHGLSGLLQVDIVNFNYSLDKAWAEPSAYAYLQLGATDIMHILYAEHLGCKYIASFDEDFKRAEDIIKEETGMQVIYGPDELLRLM